jgi:Leucine-rich repeat (LRR) protein
LNLSYNEIEEIDILSNVPFQKLKKLNLVGNEISNIGILTKVSFEELEELYINDNEIKYGDTINNKIISFLKEKYHFLKLIY